MLVWPDPDTSLTLSHSHLTSVSNSLSLTFKIYFVLLILILICCPNDLPVPINSLLANDKALVCNNSDQWETWFVSGDAISTNEGRASVTMDNQRVRRVSRWPQLISHHSESQIKAESFYSILHFSIFIIDTPLLNIYIRYSTSQYLY